MASMLFRTHHAMDTSAVDAKLKERELEYSKIKRNLGDVPHAIHADDAISCVSSFSHDTTAVAETWRKPTKDLLAHFSKARQNNMDGRLVSTNHRTHADYVYEA